MLQKNHISNDEEVRSEDKNLIFHPKEKFIQEPFSFAVIYDVALFGDSSNFYFQH